MKGFLSLIPAMEALTIIHEFGGASILARDLGIPRSRITMWGLGGIPAKYWPALMRLAASKGVLGVTIEVLETHVAPRRKTVHHWQNIPHQMAA